MIILIKKAGNHSNRLFQAMGWESYCMEKNEKFLNLCFGDMEKYYGIKISLITIIFAFVYRVLNKLKVARIVYVKSCDGQDPRIHSLKSGRLNFVEGECNRDPEQLKNHIPFFVRKYSLAASYYEGNELYQTITGMDSNRVKVGIHIRRGDYEHWRGGKYYFQDSFYINLMSKLESEIQIKLKKDVVFIVFSNDQTDIQSSEKIILSKNEWYIDQFIMSKCDYLVGPPSSFSRWASYVGDVKYYRLHSVKVDVTLDSFRRPSEGEIL